MLDEVWFFLNPFDIFFYHTVWMCSLYVTMCCCFTFFRKVRRNDAVLCGSSFLWSPHYVHCHGIGNGMRSTGL